MTQPSYDLLTEPWIPVLRDDGTADAIGLQQVFNEAHRLRGLGGETPLVKAALHRLLLAVLYRALGVPSADAWEDLWEQGRFPEKALAAYWERWRDRFDLFHPQYPFFQWPDARVKPKPIINLVPHMASGNNATLFDHHHTGQQAALRPDEAARALLVAMAFGLAGLSGLSQKFTDAPWARGVIFLAEGNTLFETLMFNYMPGKYWKELGSANSAADRPFWEAENPFEPLRPVPLGITDYLTWPNRAVRLLPEMDEYAGHWKVAQLTMAPGMPLASHVRDPYKHYRVDKQRGYLILRFREDRALWRDSASLLQLRQEDQRPPKPMTWLADLVEDDVLPRHVQYRFAALGMANNQAKIDFYREEHFPVPAEYFLMPELVGWLTEALELAEAVGRVLQQALHRLATLMLSPTADDPEGRRPDRGDVDHLTAHWGGRRMYWADLEVHFWELLTALPNAGDKALETWKQTLYHTARRAFERVAASLGETPRALKAAARADRQLNGALFCVFHPQEEKCRN